MDFMFSLTPAEKAEVVTSCDHLQKLKFSKSLPFGRKTRAQLEQVFDALRALMAPPDPPKRPIGFVHHVDKGKKASGGESKT